MQDGTVRGVMIRRRAALPLAAALATCVATAALAQTEMSTSTGSGVLIGAHGEILTAAHVVEGCDATTVQFPSKPMQPADVVARDDQNDLAVLRTANPPAGAGVAFREGKPIRPGDNVVALGYPLSGLLASSANLSVGIISALAGLGNDSRYYQISAPVQPGNSGGPLLDASGHLVGIVTAKLNALQVARVTGDVPQNVNFAVKATVAQAFLDSNSIDYQTARSEQQLGNAEVGETVRPFTVFIRCQKRAKPREVQQTPPARPDPATRRADAPRDGRETAFQVLNGYGMLGTWATDCSRPPDKNNFYTVYAGQPDGNVMRTYYNTADRRTPYNQYLITQATILPSKLLSYVQESTVNQDRIEVTLRRDGDRYQIWSSMRPQGEVLVRDGKFPNNGNMSPWQALCAR